MGVVYLTPRKPRIAGRFDINATGGISVFPDPRLPHGTYPTTHYYFPNAFLLSDVFLGGALNVPGGSGGFEIRVSVPNRTTGSLSTSEVGQPYPIPVDVKVNAFVRFSGQPIVYFEQVIRTIETLGSSDFPIKGSIEFWFDLAERVGTYPEGEVAVGPRKGGACGMAGSINGVPIVGHAANTQDDLIAGAGTYILGTMEARIDSPASFPDALGFGGYTQKSAPPASASVKLRIYDSKGETFVNEVLSGANSVSNDGASASCNGGVTASVSGNGPRGSGTTFHHVSARARMTGPLSTSYRLRGALFAMTEPHPDPVTLLLKTLNHPELTRKITLLKGKFDTGVIRQRSYTEMLQTHSGQQGNIAYSVNGGANVQTHGDIFLTADRDSLAKYGEHPLDDIVPFHGDKWNAFVMRQARSVTLDSATGLQSSGVYAGNWEPMGNAAVTKAGDAIRVKTPKNFIGNTSSTIALREWGAARTFTPPVWLSGYRFLEVRVRSVGKGNLPVTFRADNKLWRFATGAAGEWRTVTLDLCDEMATTDGKPLPLSETRDSIRYASNYDAQKVAPQESPYFGINRSAGLDFIGMAADSTYEIASLKLVRKTAPLVSFLEPYIPQKLNGSVVGGGDAYAAEWGKEWSAWTGDSAVPTFYSRGIQAETDGRMSLEEPFRVYEIAGFDRRSRFISIKMVADFIGKSGAIPPPQLPITAGLPANRNPGWYAASVSDPPTPDPTGANFTSMLRADSLASDKTALYIWGGGVLWRDGKTALPGVGIAVPEGKSLTVPAQITYESLRFWAGAGDIFGYGKTGDVPTIANNATTELRAGKVYRGQARNLLVGEGAGGDADAEAGAVVRLKETVSRRSGGEGSGDTLGRYSTGLPFAKMSRDTTKTPTTLHFPRRRLYNAYLNGAPALPLTAASRATDDGKATPKAEGLLFEGRRRRRIAFRAAGRAGVSVVSDRTAGWYGKVTARRYALLFQRTTVPVPDSLSGSVIGLQWLPPAIICAPADVSGEVFKRPALARFGSGKMTVLFERQRLVSDEESEVSAGWERSIMETTSDDDGETWSKPKDLALNQTDDREPAWFRGTGSDTGSFVAVRVRPDPANTSEGFLIGQLYDAGGKSGTVWTFGALTDDPVPLTVPMKIVMGAGYDGVQAFDTSGRWLMTLTVPGEDAPSDWTSSDDCRTWKRLP